MGAVLAALPLAGIDAYDASWHVAPSNPDTHLHMKPNAAPSSSVLAAPTTLEFTEEEFITTTS
jgi:hypothetical protein